MEYPSQRLMTWGVVLVLPIISTLGTSALITIFDNKPSTPPLSETERSTEDPVPRSEWDTLVATLNSQVILTEGVELIDATTQRDTLPPCIEERVLEGGNIFKADFCQDGRIQYVFCSQIVSKSSDVERDFEILVAEVKDGMMLVNARQPVEVFFPSLERAGDIDGDGRVEVIAFADCGGSSGSGETYIVSFAKGTPEFLHQGNETVDFAHGIVGALDIDSDGKFELVVENGRSDIGANVFHEAWYDLVNWSGSKSVVVTTRFPEFYSRTLIPHWEAGGRGDDDRAKNCQVLLARARDTFKNASHVSEQIGLSENDGGQTELRLSATNQVLHESSGNLKIVTLTPIEVGKPFELSVSATNTLSRSMRGTISLSVLSESVAVTPVSIGASFYDVGSELLSATDSGKSIETITSRTPVVESYYPTMESLESRSLLVQAIADKPGDYEFLVRATFSEPTKDFKIGLNLPDSGLRDQQGFYCLPFTLTVR